MKQDLLFEEKQKFNVWVGYIIFLATCLLSWYLVSNFNDTNTLTIMILIITSALILILFEYAELHTTYTKEGIQLKFRPFQRKYNFIDWRQVHKAEIRNYSPIKEYGGWGIRRTISNNKAYNTRGNIGLQLYLNDGKEILIGTQNPEMIENLVLSNISKIRSA